MNFESLSTNTIVFDIETIRNDKSMEYLEKHKKWKAKGNIKDPDKKLKDIKDQQENLASKAALHWWLGSIICIGIYHVEKDRYQEFYGHDEKKVLSEFFNYLEIHQGVELIGKSSKQFDIPYTIGRAIANDIGIPRALIMNKHRRIVDVDEIFSFSSQSSQTGSLNDYAWGMGITMKCGSGEHMQDMYNQTLLDDTKFQDIAKYCRGDVEITKELLRRYKKPYANLDQQTIMAFLDIKKDEDDLPC